MSRKILTFLSSGLALFAIGSIAAYFIATSINSSSTISNNQITNFQKLDDPQTYQKGYRNDDEHLKWISERSFSLRFLASKEISYQNGSKIVESYFISGTAWIVQKDTKSLNTYYLATNMHVSSVAANNGKTYKKSDLNYDGNWIETSDIDFTLNGLDVGIIGEKDAKGVYSPGTSKSTQTSDVKLRYVENKNNFASITPSLIYSENSEKNNGDFSIAYSAFETFNNFKDIKDNQKIRGENVLNPTADFSVLKVNFTKILNNPENYFYSNELKIMLENYDKHPTKFASSFNPNDKFYVGGFPSAVYNNPQDSIPRWSGLSKISVNSIELGQNTPVFVNNSIIPLPENQKQNRLEKEIDYSGKGIDNKEYYSHRNVAVQGGMDYVNLLAGSSGSMVINSNNEVIGIYWGGLQYNILNQSEILFQGRFDFINVDQNLLNTQTSSSFSNKSTGWNHFYNLKTDLDKKINGNSLIQ